MVITHATGGDRPSAPRIEGVRFMTDKTATLALEGEGLRFAGQAGSGHTIVLDDADGDAGMRPAEMLPVALAGCTAMDVVSILRKKRQSVTHYEVLATGRQRDEHPHAFTRIDVLHVVAGDALDIEAVRRSIELSATKYCSVGATLSSGMTQIHHGYRVTGDDGLVREAEVVVLGPHSAVRVVEPAGAVAVA
jgi:putative redox protein